MAEAVSWVRDEVEDVARKSRSFLTRHAGLLLLTGSITFNIVSLLGVDSVAWGHYTGISKVNPDQEEFFGLLSAKFCNVADSGALKGHRFCYIDLSYSFLGTFYKSETDGQPLKRWIALLDDCEGKGRAAFGLIIVSTILTFLSWFSVVYQKNSSGLKSKAYSVGLPLLSFLFLVIALLVWHQGCILNSAPEHLLGGLGSSSGVYLVALSAAMVGGAGLHQMIYLCTGKRDERKAVGATAVAAGGTHTLEDAETGSFEPPSVRSAVSAPPASAVAKRTSTDTNASDGPAYGGDWQAVSSPDAEGARDVYGSSSGGAYGSGTFEDDPFKT